MRDVYVDVRCLQDPNYADRGIGRHALTLLAHARAEPAIAACRLIGITDPALPPLPDMTAALLDEIRTTGYGGALERAPVLAQLSPMTHDPLMVGRLLHHRAARSVAAVYDFIPFDEPDRYLAAPQARLDYHIALRWLARYDAFCPISEDAAARLMAILHVRPADITVTGAPLSPLFEALAPAAPRHVLVIGGGDPRKNPEHAIRAHARTPGLQVAGIPVIVTGDYPADWLPAMRRLASANGGRSSLVQTPGHVDEAALGRLYAEALCVVVPSRAEGFSLPVIEAMAAGVPALGSRIPPHQELLTEECLFGRDDDAALGALLDRVQDPAWRRAVVALQASVWPRFRGPAVAARFWGAVAAQLIPAPAVLRGAKPRLAMLTPLPPDRSGVADWGAALSPALSRRVTLDLFSPTRTPAAPPGTGPIQPLSALPLLSGRYDRAVAVLGNSSFHVDIIRHLLRYGGAAIGHDSRMLGVYAAHFGEARTLALASAELGRPVQPNEPTVWLHSEEPPPALLYAEIAAAAEPLIVHASATAQEIARRHGRTAQLLPFCQQREWTNEALGPSARAAARTRMGVPVEAGRPPIVLATFGFIHPTKFPLDLLWALHLLHGWGIPARLHFVGDWAMDPTPVRALAAQLGLVPHVRYADGFVSEAAYRDHLVGADIGIQLRSTGPGSVSGVLSDSLGAGLPCVASAALADAIDAPAHTGRVPDRPSPVLVAEAVARLLKAPLSPTDAEAARNAYVTAHSPDRCAQRLCELLGL